jgi:hypothetical protein
MEALKEIARILGLDGPGEDEPEIPPAVLDLLPPRTRPRAPLWPDAEVLPDEMPS